MWSVFMIHYHMEDQDQKNRIKFSQWDPCIQSWPLLQITLTICYCEGDNGESDPCSWFNHARRIKFCKYGSNFHCEHNSVFTIRSKYFTKPYIYTVSLYSPVNFLKNLKQWESLDNMNMIKSCNENNLSNINSGVYINMQSRS